MIDTSLTYSQSLTAGAIIINIIILSVFGDKYNSCIIKITKKHQLILHKLISEQDFKSQILDLRKQITRIKRISFLYLLIVFVVQTVLLIKQRYLASDDFILSLTTFIIFTVLMLGIYWLKGRGAFDPNKRLPGFERF